MYLLLEVSRIECFSLWTSNCVCINAHVYGMLYIMLYRVLEDSVVAVLVDMELAVVVVATV